MANDRLRSSIVAAGFSLADVAERVEVDPKTVERWVAAGRLPRVAHRRQTAELLGRDEYYLWPQAAHERLREQAPGDELIQLFSTRGAVPQDLWSGLVAGARENVDVLAYSALFLTDTNPDLTARLQDRSRDGVRVRICLGDPSSDAIRQRGQEEGIGDGLRGRVQLQLSYLGALAGSPGIELRLHGTTLYTSMFRFDDELLVNLHTYGVPAAQSPVVHLHRLGEGRLFEHYAAAYERVWESADAAQPVEEVVG